MVYFLKSPAGPIKIGTTIRLSQRLRQLAAEHGEGLEVLAVVDGSFEVDRALHSQFAHLRRAGEWFEPGDDLLGFIASGGRPWDGADEVPGNVTTPVHLSSEAMKWARIASGFTGEKVSDYINRVIIEESKRSLDRLHCEAFASA